MTAAALRESNGALRAGVRVAGKLEILRRLGEGGMGTVWVARNLSTEAEVAIKVLRPEGDDATVAHSEERFRHEARLGAMLAHRNITQVYDLLENDGSLVLVMELLHGQTLEASARAHGGMSSVEAVEIITPILGALQHAHDHGVVHRDVKPSNIFVHVDPDGHTTPKLLDFGIAKMRDSSLKTRVGDVLGTPSYMSPEQVRASPQLDGRSDIFSIGVILYEMITGENPFRTDVPTATLARVLEAEVDPDPRIEPRLWLEIQRALSKQSYERHASASELAAALSNAVGRVPRPKVEARPELAQVATAVADVDAVTAVNVMEAVTATPDGRRRRAALLAWLGGALFAFAGVLLIIAARRAPKSATGDAVASPSTSAETAPTIPTGEASEAAETAIEFPANTEAVPRPGARRPAAPRQTPKRPAASGKPTASGPPIAATPGF